MATRHCECASAAVAGALLLWAMWLVPAGANEVMKSTDGQSAGSQASALSGGEANQLGHTALPGVAIGQRKVMTDRWNGGATTLNSSDALSLFGGNEILSDASLFGVGAGANGDLAPWLSAGHVGRSRPPAGEGFQHGVVLGKGLQVAFGSFAPTRLTSLSDDESSRLLGDAPVSHFESELSYSSAFSGGNFRTWIDTLWHDTSPTCLGLGTTAAACNDNSRRGWGIGSTLGFMGFELVGYFQDSKSLGLNSRFNQNARWSNASGNVVGRKSDGYFVRGSYALSGKTKVGLSYSEGSLETSGNPGVAASVTDKRVERQLWTVGVYHDVSSWLRLMAEYNRGELNTQSARKDPSANAISVGTFLYW
jgi:Gram-negative porin